MAESKNYLAEFGSTQTGGGRVFLIDIYEHWNKEKSKPVGLVTTFFHHNVKTFCTMLESTYLKPKQNGVLNVFVTGNQEW